MLSHCFSCSDVTFLPPRNCFDLLMCHSVIAKWPECDWPLSGGLWCTEHGLGACATSGGVQMHLSVQLMSCEKTRQQVTTTYHCPLFLQIIA